MDKLQLTGKNLNLVFNSIIGCMCAKRLCCYEAKWLNLKLKTEPKKNFRLSPTYFCAPRIATWVNKLGDNQHFICTFINCVAVYGTCLASLVEKDDNGSLGATTLSIMTCNIKTLSIMTLNINDTHHNYTQHNGTQYCNNECHAFLLKCWVSLWWVSL